MYDWLISSWQVHKLAAELPEDALVVWLGLSTHGAKGHFVGRAWPLEEAYNPDWFSSSGPGLPASIGRCDPSVNPSSTAVSQG